MSCHKLRKNAYISYEEKFTINFLGNYIANCDNCYPLQMDSTNLCLPECFFPYSSSKTNVTTIKEQIDLFFQNKDEKSKPKQPVFIIGYGPPASGKGSIVKVLSRLRKDLNISEKNTIDGGLVDKIIQTTKQWDASKKYIEKMCKSNEEKQAIKQKLYTTFRFISDQISDQILYKAAANRWNIYWETTGWSNNYPSENIKMFQKMGYKTICIYPYVEQSNILNRARKRAISEGQEPKPNSGIINVIGKALENLMELRKSKIDEIIFIDNTGEKNEERILFTSQRKHKYKIKCEGNSTQIYSSLKKRNASTNKLYNKPRKLIKSVKKCSKKM